MRYSKNAGGRERIIKCDVPWACCHFPSSSSSHSVGAFPFNLQVYTLTLLWCEVPTSRHTRSRNRSQMHIRIKSQNATSKPPFDELGTRTRHLVNHNSRTKHQQRLLSAHPFTLSPTALPPSLFLQHHFSHLQNMSQGFCSSIFPNSSYQCTVSHFTKTVVLLK